MNLDSIKILNLRGGINLGKKLWALLGVCGMIGSTLVGCGGGQKVESPPSNTTKTEGEKTTNNTATTSEGTSKGVTEITFWHSMGGAGGEAIDSLTEKFNASQDKIKVTSQYQGSYDDAINKLKSAALGNAGPDIMQLYDIGTRWMMDSGYALTMQDMIDADGYDIGQLEPNILAYYTVDDKLYSMPFNSSTPLLYYNKDAFKEAGLDPEKPPKNFDEILEYSKKLMKKEGDQVVQYGSAIRIYGWFFEQFIAKQNKNFANSANGRQGEGATAVEFDANGAGKNILDKWKELIDSGYVANFGRNGDTNKDVFASGKCAIILESTAIVTNLKKAIDGKFEMGTAYFPAVNKEDNGGVSIGGGSLWMLDKKEDERHKASWEFIKFLVSPESQVEWSKSTGYFPITSKAYDLPEMAEHLKANPEFETAIKQLHEIGNSTGALLGVFPEARACIEENIEKMLNGECTSDEAVQNAAATINKALERYNKTK